MSKIASRKFHSRPLWWLLAPVAIALLLLTFQAFLQARQHEAIESIEKLGGRVLTTQGEPDWLGRLTKGKSRKLFVRATVVNLSETEITDSDLVALTSLRGVERLNLHGTAVTNRGLSHLEDLTGLKALDLSETQIDGEGLRHLRNMRDLEYLYLQETRIRDRDLLPLYELQNLRHLNLAATPVTEEGVEDIHRRLPEVDVRP